MNRQETIKEINKELQSIQLRIASCDKVLKELESTGQAWAIDSRRYRINEAAKYKFLTMAAELKQWRKGLKDIALDL